MYEQLILFSKPILKDPLKMKTISFAKTNIYKYKTILYATALKLC